MPLPSVLNGANQCQVLTKRTRQQCKNPAAFGCASCRMHGAHKSKNVLRGVNHPQYKTGGETLEAKAMRSEKSEMFRYLTDIGNHCKLFYKEIKTKGRPPSGYEKLDLTDPEQLALAIMKTLGGK
jgi:hypothetical protein